MERWSIGVSELKYFEFRVSRSGLKYCKLNSAVHDPQLVTRNTQRKNEPNAPKLIEIENSLHGLPSLRLCIHLKHITDKRLYSTNGPGVKRLCQTQTFINGNTGSRG